MNTMIASAAEEQSAVAAEMQTNMNNIRELADRSAEGAQQTAQASEELVRLALFMLTSPVREAHANDLIFLYGCPPDQIFLLVLKKSKGARFARF